MTYFGDFFLRSTKDGRYAVLMPMWPHLSRLKYSDRESFVEVYLKREYVVRQPDGTNKRQFTPSG